MPVSMLEAFKLITWELQCALGCIARAIEDPDGPEWEVFLKSAWRHVDKMLRFPKGSGVPNKRIVHVVRESAIALARANKRAGFSPNRFGSEHEEAVWFCKEWLNCLCGKADPERREEFLAMQQQYFSQSPVAVVKGAKAKRERERLFTIALVEPLNGGMRYRQSELNKNAQSVKEWLKRQVKTGNKADRLAANLNREFAFLKESDFRQAQPCAPVQRSNNKSKKGAVPKRMESESNAANQRAKSTAKTSVLPMRTEGKREVITLEMVLAGLISREAIRKGRAQTAVKIALAVCLDPGKAESIRKALNRAKTKGLVDSSRGTLGGYWITHKGLKEHEKHRRLAQQITGEKAGG